MPVMQIPNDDDALVSPQDWLPGDNRYTRQPFEVSDLIALCDRFGVPWQYGPAGPMVPFWVVVIARTRKSTETTLRYAMHDPEWRAAVMSTYRLGGLEAAQRIVREFFREKFFEYRDRYQTRTKGSQR